MTTSLVERATRVFPQGSINDFILPEGRRLVVDRADGTQLFDSTGREYVDYLLGSGPLVLGHNHPEVARAVTAQFAAGSTYYLPSAPAIELAERICHYVPCAEAVRYCSDGSEAVFYALRLARAFTGRSAVLKFEGGFHGHTDYALQSFAPADPPPSFPRPRPDSRGIPTAVSETVYVAPYNDLAAVDDILEMHGSEVAAIVAEPVQRGIEAQPGFLAGLRAAADRIGALLIFDEVVTGFRVDLSGAQGLAGVIPDICALGKAMSGGLPVAAIAGRRDVMALAGRPDATDGVYMSGTLNGNPLCCAAGLAAVDTLAEVEGCTTLSQRGAQLRDGLEAVFASAGIVATTIGPGAFLEVVFGRDQVHNYRDYIAGRRAAAIEFGLGMLDRGFFVRPGTKIYLSVLHTAAQIDQFIAAAADTIAELQGRGVIDGADHVAVLEGKAV